MRRPLLALTLTASAVALPATPAAAVVVPQEGMAGVKLQMSQADVRGVLGSPTESRTTRDDFGRQTRWYFKGPKIHVVFREGPSGLQVTSLLTRRGFERTARGVGVGSTISTLRSRVKGVKCERFPGSSTRSCYLGAFEPGRTVTDFRVGRSGKVGAIVIGFVID